MQKLKEIAMDPEHSLISDDEKRTFLSCELDENTIEERFAELMGKKKPKHLRSEADEKALAAADKKRRRKAQKRREAMSRA